MQAAVLREKMRCQAPDIYIKPEIENIRVLEFYKVDEIYQQSASARDRLYRKLRKYRRRR
jgi:NTE family protein